MKNNLNEWCKDWAVSQLACFLTSMGMEFQASACTKEELKQDRKVIVNEINRRIREAKKLSEE